MNRRKFLKALGITSVIAAAPAIALEPEEPHIAIEHGNWGIVNVHAYGTSVLRVVTSIDEFNPITRKMETHNNIFDDYIGKDMNDLIGVVQYPSSYIVPVCEASKVRVYFNSGDVIECIPIWNGDGFDTIEYRV